MSGGQEGLFGLDMANLCSMLFEIICAKFIVSLVDWQVC